MTSDRDPLDLIAAYRPTQRGLDDEWPAARRTALLERIQATPAQDVPDVPAATRVRVHSRRRWVVAAAVGVAAAALVPLVLPSDQPGGATSAAAKTLERLAIAAEKTPADAVKPGQFRHLIDVETQAGMSSRTHESWTAYDGRTWRRDTAAGNTEYFEFPAGGANVNAPTPQFLQSLPTDPGKLHRYLEKHVSGSTSRDEAVFVAVGDMLRGGFAPPTLRAAAIRMLERAGHVTVLQGKDSAGHPAIVVRFRDPVQRPGETNSLYFDPATSAIEEETTTSCDQSMFAVPGAASASATAGMPGVEALPTTKAGPTGQPPAVVVTELPTGSAPAGDQWNSPAPPSVGCTAADSDPVFFRSVYSGSATVDTLPADVRAKAKLQN